MTTGCRGNRAFVQFSNLKTAGCDPTTPLRRQTPVSHFQKMSTQAAVLDANQRVAQFRLSQLLVAAESEELAAGSANLLATVGGSAIHIYVLGSARVPTLVIMKNRESIVGKVACA
jgi:hypothetical protein